MGAPPSLNPKKAATASNPFHPERSMQLQREDYRYWRRKVKRAWKGPPKPEPENLALTDPTSPAYRGLNVT